MDARNRESWLNRAAEALKLSLFAPAGYAVPPVKISVGFPGGGSPRKRIGEHWSPEASEDRVGSVFISPVVSETAEALAVLVHEMVHAAVGNAAGHGPVFKRCALKVGLQGRMRSTVAGPELLNVFEGLVATIGPYPHSRLNLSKRPGKKQSTRLIKMSCPDCGYIVRASRASIETFGPVICPGCREPMIVE